MYKFLVNIISKFPFLKRQIVFVRDFTVYQIRKIFIFLGFLKSHKGYTKFVIIGLPRTGTNFLKGLLNNHKNAYVYGELFRFQYNIGWDLRYFPQSKSLNIFKNSKPIGFLKKEIFNRHRSETLAVGFKLLYHQARSINHTSVWDYIRDSSDIRVIHMKRRNYLKRYLSLKKARDTGKWIKFNDEETGNYDTTLSFEACQKEFVEVDKDIEAMDKFLRQKSTITIFYEDIESDTDRELVKILNFLGIPNKQLKANTFKQSQNALQESINNFNELKEKFSNSKWSHFFEA